MIEAGCAILVVILFYVWLIGSATRMGVRNIPIGLSGSSEVGFIHDPRPRSRYEAGDMARLVQEADVSCLVVSFSGTPRRTRWLLCFIDRLIQQGVAVCIVQQSLSPRFITFLKGRGIRTIGASTYDEAVYFNYVGDRAESCVFAVNEQGAIPEAFLGRVDYPYAAAYVWAPSRKAAERACVVNQFERLPDLIVYPSSPSFSALRRDREEGIIFQGGRGVHACGLRTNSLAVCQAVRIPDSLGLYQPVRSR